MLARTPRGRVATPAAWRHLGETPPERDVPEETDEQGPPTLFG
jgi:Holliday junction DNA helicase RuvB